jgi:hypothetical protein
MYAWPPLPATKSTLVGLETLADGDFLPEQFFGTAEDHRWEGERGLMLAVLEEAVKDFQRLLFAKSPAGRMAFEEVEEWFKARGDSEWPFSFENICNTIGVNPDVVVRGLQKWKFDNPTKPVSSFVRRKCHSKEKDHGRKHASSRNSPCHT